MVEFGCDMRRHALLARGIALLAMGTGSCVPPSDAAHVARPVDAGAGGAGALATARPEDAWLATVGTGAAQTARVCGRGAKDRVASVLCAPSASSIRGLTDLYRALGLGDPANRAVASTTHSLALSARIVSAANPRTFVFTHEPWPVPYDHVIATAFVRGEQLVELVGLDPGTIDYNFYLLRFEQACNASSCTPDDLLTAKIESGWTGFTLYADKDLEDTPLDCLSCHQPFGPGTHKQLVMRQTANPWLHWDFRGIYENRICGATPFPEPGRFIPGDGLELMARLESANGQHAGVPVRELGDATSGERFTFFLSLAENTIRQSPYPAGYVYEQVDYDSIGVLCEWLQKGTRGAWERDRAYSMQKGLPVPYHSPDVTDPARRAEIDRDRAGFLARHAAEDAFDVAMSLISADATAAVGFVPRSDDTAEQILRAMCVRCHAATTEKRLKRARFNAESLERIDPGVAQVVRERIRLPRSSPLLMPPVRAGELPPWAIERIEAFLRERCSVPGGCD
jgi:cytochrome c553